MSNTPLDCQRRTEPDGIVETLQTSRHSVAVVETPGNAELTYYVGLESGVVALQLSTATANRLSESDCMTRLSGLPDAATVTIHNIRTLSTAVEIEIQQMVEQLLSEPTDATNAETATSHDA